MAEIYFIVLTAILIAGFGLVFFLISRQQKTVGKDQSLLMLQNQINEIARTLDSKLGESTRAMQQQFSESSKIIREITKELTKVGESQKQVSSVADQLKNLQDILKNPKQRGVLGEYYLKTVLENILPPGVYEMQYRFENGDTVDAIIKTKEGLIPVDSKFSLENYNRILEAQTVEERNKFEMAFVNDLKLRIEETAKYIKPAEGTLNFAFMFIPSEAVYYDLLINKIGAVKENTTNLIEYAWKKNVSIVSPTTFFAYLQTILQGLKALRIEESAKEIRKRVEELGKHLANWETYMKKLGLHLGTTVNMYSNAYKELGKIDRDVLKITGKAIDIEPMTIEGPKVED
jgi:DNA recombination protein RmuC